MKWLDTVATVLDVLTANCTFCKIKIVVSFRENEQTWPPFLVLAKCFRLFALWNTTWHFFSLINPKAWAKMAGIVNKDYCRTTLKESHTMWARLLEGQQHHLNEIRCISNWGNVNQSTPRILFQLLFFFSVPISFKNNISKIHVWHDNVGEHPGWFLERITIKDVSDGMKWYANSNPYSASTLTNST